MIAKIDISAEHTIIDDLKRFYHEETGFYKTRSKFLRFLVLLGIVEAMRKAEDYVIGDYSNASLDWLLEEDKGFSFGGHRNE
jgi:hypothetical protein